MMEECFPASILVAAGLLQVAGASRSEPWSSHATDQSSLEKGLVTDTGDLVPLPEGDATQVTFQFDSFTTDHPNDGLSQSHEVLRMEANSSQEEGQPLTFPDRQPRRSEFSFLEGAVSGHKSQVPSTNRPPISRSVPLSGFSEKEAESISQPEPLTPFLPREGGLEDATGHDPTISGKQSLLIPTKAAEMDLLATTQPEDLQSARQRMTTNSSPSRATSSGNPLMFTLGKNMAESEAVLADTTLTLAKEGLERLPTFLPTSSQRLLANSQEMQPDLRTSDIPQASRLSAEAQFNSSAPSPSQQRSLLEERMAVRLPYFASAPHEQIKRVKAVSLKSTENPALLTPSPSHTHFPPLLLTPGSLSSGMYPQSSTPENASESNQPKSIFPSQFPPSNKPSISEEANKRLQESLPLTLQQETQHHMTTQTSHFKLSQSTAVLRDPVSLSNIPETTPKASVPTQDQLQALNIDTVYANQQGEMLSTSSSSKATSAHVHPTMPHVAASSHVQQPLPAMPDAAGHVMQGTPKIHLPSAFLPLVHGQQLSLSTSAPPLTESDLFAVSSASVPSKPPTPGVSDTVSAGSTRPGMLTSPPSVLQHESEQLSTRTAASVHTMLSTLGSLASAHAGLHSSVATDSVHSTPGSSEWSTLVHNEPSKRTLGMPFQAEHLMIGDLVSAQSRTTIPETTHPFHAETDAADAGLNGLGTAARDHTKPKLSTDISSPFYATTRPLPIRVYTKLQPDTPSMLAAGPQMSVLGVTMPTITKSQKTDASASSLKEAQLFVAPVHARAKLITNEAPAEQHLPVFTVASSSIATHAKTPMFLSAPAQARHFSHGPAQFGTSPLARSGTQIPNSSSSSPVQLLGHLSPQPSRTFSDSVQNEFQPHAVSSSADPAPGNPEVLSTLHHDQQLVLPGMRHTTAKEMEDQSSFQSNLPKSHPVIYSTPLPGVSAAVPSQKAEGSHGSSDSLTLGSLGSQTAHHKKPTPPVLSSVRMAEHFPGLKPTSVWAVAPAQEDALHSSQGFILHLLNQSDASSEENQDPAVAGSYLGLPPSLQYFSFSIRSTEDMICLQPAQSAAPLSGEPNTSVQGVASFQEMLISSTFLGLSHFGASSLIQMNPSNVVLVKPMFVFLPAGEPEDLVRQERAEGHSFTKAAGLPLVTSSQEQPAESHSTIRQSARTSSLPPSRQALSGSVLGSLPEYTAGSSRMRSVNLKADAFPDSLREVITPRTKSVANKEQEEGFWPPIPDPPKSGDNNTIPLSLEHRVSAAAPVMVPVHQRHSTLPPTAELPSSPPRRTSFSSLPKHPASQMLARTSRSEDKTQLNTTLMLRAENQQRGSVTPVTSSSKNFEESLSTSSAGNTDLPLEVVKHLTPLRAESHRFLITKVFNRKRPSDTQHIPSTVSKFPTISTVKNFRESTAVRYANSQAVTALPRTTETSYLMNGTLAKVPQSHFFSPTPPRASERPKSISVLTSFLAYIQARSTLSEKHLEDVNPQVPSRPSVSPLLPKNPRFATSAMQDNQTSLTLPGSISLVSAERQTFATVSSAETSKKVRDAETHNPGDATHFTPTMPRGDSALLVSTEFRSALASSGGTMGYIGFQGETHTFPLTIFQSLSRSSASKDTTALQIDRVPLLEMPRIRDLHSLQLSVTTAANKAVFFSRSTPKKELIQHGGKQKAGVTAAFLAPSHLQSWPANLDDGHRDRARLRENEPAWDSGSSLPSLGSTSPSSGSFTVANAPTFLVTTLSSGLPPDTAVDKVLNQTFRLRSLPLGISKTTPSFHPQVLLTLKSPSDTSAITAEGDFMVEATSTGELDESYLHAVEKQVTVVGDTTEEATKDPLDVVLPQSDSSSSLLEWKLYHRRPTRSDNDFLDGFAVVSDDACSSGNYTAEMSLHHASDQPPSHADTFLAQIVLQSNTSHPTLKVESCCVTPTARTAGPETACCLFPRTQLGCRYIQLHQNSQPETARFTIQLFQMLNCSVAYLHCELSVCLSKHAGCEQSCSENRERRFKPGGQSSYQTHHNLISFGPVLRAPLEFPSKPAAESNMAMMFQVLLGLLVGIVILLGISIFIWFHWRPKIKMAANLEGQGFCMP